MFFQIDDQLQVNAKARALAERLMEDDNNGLAALGLWTMAGSLVQASLTDGVVTKADLARLTLNPSSAFALASLLVDVGLWHAHGHDCERCAPVSDGTWLFHDWFDLKYDRGEQVKTTRRKRKELTDSYLLAQVWARDCTDYPSATTGLCRYCGKELKRKDRRSDDAWQPDHVDPSKAAGPENVVLACGPCNRKKGRRTPEIAGMTLRPAPNHEVDPRTTAADPSATRSTSTAEAHADRPEWAADRTETRSTSTAEKPDVGRQEPAADPSNTVQGHGAIPTDQADISLIPAVISGSSELSSSAGTPTRGHARKAGQGRVGPGSSGVDQGSPGSGGDGQGRPGKRRGNRRRRGGRRNPQPSDAGTAPIRGDSMKGRGGSPPEIPVPSGQFGSPWFNASRKNSTDEAECFTHGEPAPCRFCVRGER